jgi:hypothetical protein
MYVNGKIISIETLPGIGEWAKKENGGMVDFKYGIFDNTVRTFVNATMYPLPAQRKCFASKKEKL